jgi:hypothetical protein
VREASFGWSAVTIWLIDLPRESPPSGATRRPHAPAPPPVHGGPPSEASKVNDSFASTLGEQQFFGSNTRPASASLPQWSGALSNASGVESMHRLVEVPDGLAGIYVPTSQLRRGIRSGRSLLHRRGVRQSGGVVSRHFRNLISGLDAGRKETPWSPSM